MTNNGTQTALHLKVNNHPGVMSHVCGLFARRAFNLEAIAVTPINGGATCDMWLLVNEDERMDQVVKQVSKLHDVLNVDRHPSGSPIFDRLVTCLSE